MLVPESLEAAWLVCTGSAAVELNSPVISVGLEVAGTSETGGLELLVSLVGVLVAGSCVEGEFVSGLALDSGPAVALVDSLEEGVAVVVDGAV